MPSPEHPVPAAKRRRSRARVIGAVRERAPRRLNESKRSAHIAEALIRRLWRSTSSAEHVETRQARTVAECLAVIGLPAAVLSPTGKLVAANRLFEALIPETVRTARGRPRLVDPTADRLIEDLISRSCSVRGGSIQPIPLRLQNGKAPTMVHFFPVPAVAGDVFEGLGAIVVVTTAQARAAPSLEMLRNLFDLSPAEARVAQCIAARRTVEAIADRSGVSRETVRSQLKSVLAKTGTKRQLDLAVLLLGLSPQKIVETTQMGDAERSNFQSN